MLLCRGSWSLEKFSEKNMWNFHSLCWISVWINLWLIWICNIIIYLHSHYHSEFIFFVFNFEYKLGGILSIIVYCLVLLWVTCQYFWLAGWGMGKKYEQICWWWNNKCGYGGSTSKVNIITTTVKLLTVWVLQICLTYNYFMLYHHTSL